MTEDLVITRLLRVERMLCLARTEAAAGAPGQGAPAVLTISRGGRPYEPRLMLFGDHDTRDATRLGALVLTDSHVVAHCDGHASGGRREIADVLMDQRLCMPPASESHLRRRLERYPGCEVAVARWSDGHLAVARDGAALVMTCDSSGAEEMWNPISGSFLYCWSAAGLPLAELAQAVLIVGRYTAPNDADQGRLTTVGRIHITEASATSDVRKVAS
ncbi:hypothetical protein [Actinomadura chokoriensis]|uniref:Uncharacterized protein n=1 Tax=Actinomadura chokoriensis TaxID=454156 RepID=A0ABV4QTP0_9ACTN